MMTTADASLYRNFYQIFPRAFADSNGDGFGDLKGITQHLDYLNTGDPASTTDLKVDGIWLTPIYPTESYHGYDVMDYKAINPKLGTMEDFDTLIATAQQRGIAVILDLVINHTSSHHPWFQKALAGDPKYVAYYNWSDTPQPGYVLTDQGKRGGGTYYEGQFSRWMPDLNLSNPEVRGEIADITKFWLDRGVAGFRLDAVLYYYQNDNDQTTDFTRWLVDTVKSQKKDAYIVGEVFSKASDIDAIYHSGIDSLFNFPAALEAGTGSSPILAAVAEHDGKGFAHAVAAWQKEMADANPTAIDAPFLSNHDTDRSSLTFTTLDMKKLAASTYLLMPGNPFIYYGEEIGMTGAEHRQNNRLPMLWSADGKDSPQPFEGSTETAETDGGSVEEQEQNPDSLLNWYKKVLRTKAKYPQIASGTVTAVQTDDTSLAVLNYDSGTSDGSGLTIATNYSASDAATLRLSDSIVGTALADVLSVHGDPARPVDGQLSIPPQTTVILTR
jgi:alpha-amylase